MRQKNDSSPAAFATVPLMAALGGELRAGLARYWSIADAILRQCGVTLVQPTEEDFSLSRNFFSFLFLYSFHRAGVHPRRRTLYAAMLQCLRGMVTGCDNLLDDEYKKTLETDIPPSGHRFRSVVDIMVSDRVLFTLLADAAASGDIAGELVAKVAAASMESMTRSGVQEAAEEAGVEEILEPETVLSSVHHFKTGLLFTCPWDIPERLETIEPVLLSRIKEALYAIGMGCQIMDDIVDFRADISMRRHNFLVSLITHGEDEEEKRLLRGFLRRRAESGGRREAPVDFPRATGLACMRARTFLQEGLGGLFGEEHAFLVSPALTFLQNRIGVDLEDRSR